MSTLRHVSSTAALGLGLFLLPSLALAAPDPDVPKGTAGQDAASSGSTEIGAGGGTFSSATDVGTEEEPAEGEEAVEDPHANDATQFDIAAGGQFNTGNSTTLAATGLTNFRLRRTIHQFAAQAAGNYGAARNDDSDRYEANTANVQGLVRYDVFFAKRWTAFLQTTMRHDPFQGLNLRMNVDPGFAIYVINKSNHRLWFEAGYDFQYDLRTPESRALRNEDGMTIDEMGMVLEDQDTGIIVDDENDPGYVAPFFINHAARLYAGYSNKLSEKVSFDTGLEYLQSVIEADRLRLNYLAALNTNIVERLSVSVTFTLRFDNKPVTQDIRKLDTVTAIALSYSFF